MAIVAGDSWWVIGYYPESTLLPGGGSAQFQYFYGTKAQAEAQQQLAVNGTLSGPYSTEEDAKAAAAKLPTKEQSSAQNVASSLNPANWNLQVSGVAGWFFRGLKVLFGGVLMIIGISKLTGIDNKITQLASKIPVVPV